MRIHFSCPQCQTGYSTRPDQAGKKGICKVCSAHLVVPEPTPESRMSSKDQPFTSRNNLLVGFKHPFKTGARLWRRSLRTVLNVIGLPCAGIFLLLGLVSPGDSTANQIVYLIPGTVGSLLCIYSVIVTFLLISRTYIGQSVDDIYRIALQRFLPTVATWLITFAIVLVATLFLIIPGVILFYRLFWADEFALMNGQSPISAIRSSYQLTRGSVGQIFSFQTLHGLLANLLCFVSGIVTLPIVLLGNFLSAKSFEALSMAVSGFLFIVVYAFLHANQAAYFYGLLAEKSPAA